VVATKYTLNHRCFVV